MVNLEVQIEEKRKEMIDLGMTKGFSDPETIKASQELDILIFEKQKGEIHNGDRRKSETVSKGSELVTGRSIK